MLSIRSTDSLSLRSDPNISAAIDLEQQIQNIDNMIRPLLKIQKKLSKVEDELTNVNFLIGSGNGSKSDQKALRQTKKEIRQRRIELKNKLEALPRLEEERRELTHKLGVLHHRHGLQLWQLVASFLFLVDRDAQYSALFIIIWSQPDKFEASF